MKNTRRFISAVMALAMVSAIAPMSAFAINQDDVKNGNGKATGTMTATYDVTAKYTVTIPAGVELKSDASVSKDITASDVVLESGKKITVKLTEASNTAEGSSFSAKNDKGDSTATYTISKGETAVAVGDVVAEFTENGEQSLTFSKAEGATYAGTHTETLTFGISVEDSVESVLAPVLENGATMVVTYKWNGYNTTTFTFTNNNGTYSCNVGGDEPQDFSGSLTLNGTTLALSITNSVMSSKINLAISFDTTNDTYSFVTKGSWYNSHTVSVNGTNITDKLTAKN